MLASLEDLDDYDVTARPQICSQVTTSSVCSLCRAEPLPLESSYAETLVWLERNRPATALEMMARTSAELAEIESSMGGRSGGDPGSPIQWRAIRRTHAYDSQLRPGYATSVVSLQIAMADMDQEQRDFFANTFLAAICDICAARADEDKDLLLLSYVNQWADGNADVAHAQPNWRDVEHVAAMVRAVTQLESRSA